MYIFSYNISQTDFNIFLSQLREKFEQQVIIIQNYLKPIKRKPKFFKKLDPDKIEMQKLFYVTCRWLQEDNSRQSMRISDMIKEQMQQTGFNYESISNTERQREELYREREKLIIEKEKLEEQKRQIEQERQHNLRLIQEKQKLQRQREHIQQRLHQQKDQAEDLREENQELQQKRNCMVHEYQRLQQERDKIIEERQVLYERMEKIEKLQRLQRMYQEELRRLREEAQNQHQTVQEEKTQDQEQNQIEVPIPKHVQIVNQPSSTQNSSLVKQQEEPKIDKPLENLTSQNNPVSFMSGFTTINSNPAQYSAQGSFSSQPYRYISSQASNEFRSSFPRTEVRYQSSYPRTQIQYRINLVKTQPEPLNNESQQNKSSDSAFLFPKTNNKQKRQDQSSEQKK